MELCPRASHSKAFELFSLDFPLFYLAENFNKIWMLENIVRGIYSTPLTLAFLCEAPPNFHPAFAWIPPGTGSSLPPKVTKHPSTGLTVLPFVKWNSLSLCNLSLVRALLYTYGSDETTVMMVFLIFEDRALTSHRSSLQWILTMPDTSDLALWQFLGGSIFLLVK